MNTLQELFGNFPLSRFVVEHLHRLPIALADTCHGLTHLGSWEVLGEMLGAPNVDVMVVRQGGRFDGAPPRDRPSAELLSQQGCTILVRHAERHHPAIGEIAETFSAALQAPANVHIYATPPGSFGFSWHYDAEDVFILQTAGEKEYGLRKNTVHPWPLEETIPADMRYERELMPLMRAMLRKGDLLYIPCGYWHRAQATPSGDTAISLAVGVMSRSAIDVFDLLRPLLVQSPVWRQRLPAKYHLPDASTDSTVTLNYMIDQLVADLTRTIKSAEFGRLVEGLLSYRAVPANAQTVLPADARLY